jgi:lipopolysaccharide/colanic/teichoic acid biosynthesis glycosyltransferase
MTGLWQVTARQDPSFKRCVELDIEYITHWNVMLDIKILCRTITAVLQGSGA